MHSLSCVVSYADKSVYRSLLISSESVLLAQSKKHLQRRSSPLCNPVSIGAPELRYKLRTMCNRRLNAEPAKWRLSLELRKKVSGKLGLRTLDCFSACFCLPMTASHINVRKSTPCRSIVTQKITCQLSNTVREVLSYYHQTA